MRATADAKTRGKAAKLKRSFEDCWQTIRKPKCA